MKLKENQKLWFLGVAAIAIGGFVVIALKNIKSFVDQFSFSPTVKSVSIVGANLFHIPPVLGNAKITLDVRIDNPLSSSHAITDFSIRIFEATNGSTQLGNSLPISDKITIPAASSSTISNIQLLIPVQSLLGQLSIDQAKTMISTGKFTLNRTYRIAVHLKLDGIAGDTETTIKL